MGTQLDSCKTYEYFRPTSKIIFQSGTPLIENFELWAAGDVYRGRVDRVGSSEGQSRGLIHTAVFEIAVILTHAVCDHTPANSEMANAMVHHSYLSGCFELLRVDRDNDTLHRWYESSPMLICSRA